MSCQQVSRAVGGRQNALTGNNYGEPFGQSIRGGRSSLPPREAEDMENPDDWRREALERGQAIMEEIGGITDEQPLESLMDEWDEIISAYETPELLPLLDDVYEEAQRSPEYNFPAHLAFRLMEWGDGRLLKLEAVGDRTSEKAYKVQTVFRAAFEYLEAMELHERTQRQG